MEFNKNPLRPLKGELGVKYFNEFNDAKAPLGVRGYD
jgi:hypothetical protein